MGAKKIGVNRLEKGLKGSSADSSPAPGTLIIRQLKTATDKIRTNMLNFKPPCIYDAGGDVTKQWFVYYSFRDPSTGKFKRFKVFMDLNSHKHKVERMEKAMAIQQSIKELLEDGFNPFKISRVDLNFSIVECIDVFLKNIEPQLRVKSFNRYKYEFRLMKKWFIENGFEKLHISEVKRMHVFDFLEYAKKEGRWTSGKTYNTHKSNISRLFNYFINNYDEVIEKNPVLRIESKPEITRGNQPYNEKEFKAIQDAILERDPYLWRICQFVYYAAVRNEREGLNLLCGDIDFTSNQIIIRPELSKGKKKQLIPIYPEFLNILKNEMKLNEYPPNWYIFGRGDKPGPVRVGKDNFYERFKKIRDSIGLSKYHGIYSFKHTRGCNMVEDGATLYEIQTLFRHESLQATMAYLKSVGRVIGEKQLSKSRIV